VQIRIVKHFGASGAWLKHPLTGDLMSFFMLVFLRTVLYGYLSFSSMLYVAGSSFASGLYINTLFTSGLWCGYFRGSGAPKVEFEPLTF